MSTAAIFQLAEYPYAFSRIEPQVSVAVRYSLGNYSGETSARSEGIRFHPIAKTPTADDSAKKPKLRTKRRLKGFLVEMQGKDARVAFIEDDQTILYDLPADQLRNAGVTIRNQPFQMDEIEMSDGSGGWIAGYRFLALAKPADAFIEPLNFDEERRRKRDLILKEFGQAKG